MQLGKMILNNFWIKVISLGLAFITWFYVVSEIEGQTGKKNILTKIIPSYNRMISKKLFVKAVFTGDLPENHKLIVEEVKIDPPYFIIAGPKYMLSKINSLETVPIDLSELKKTVTSDAQIAPISPSVDTEKLIVKVTIPIKKTEPGTPSD